MEPEPPLHAHDACAWDVQLFSPRTAPKGIPINPAAQPSKANECPGVQLRLGATGQRRPRQDGLAAGRKGKAGQFSTTRTVPARSDCGQEERMYDMILAPPAGSNHPRGRPGGHYRYLRQGVPAPPMPKAKYL